MHLARIGELLRGGGRRRGLQEFAEARARIREAPRRQLDLKRVQRRRDAFHLVIVHHLKYPTNGPAAMCGSRMLTRIEQDVAPTGRRPRSR